MPARILSLLLALLLLAGCADDAAPSDGPPPLILISLDGFRWDYLDLHDAPHLRALAESGVWAEQGMTPVFPTMTFPNHYSIVTGLYPEHHGIVHNTIYDPDFDAWFRISDPEAVTDARWWGGEPIWVTAETQGLRSGINFWPGSEAPIRGIRPSYWTVYDGSVPGEDRIDRILAWLDLPPDERPGLLMVYFSDVDTQGHEHGPESDETAAAVARVDAHIGRLLDGLADRDLADAVNLLVVADHGMAEVSSDRLIALDEFVDPADVEVVNDGSFLALRPPADRVEAVYEALAGAHPHLSVYLRDETPDALHFRTHRRIAPIVGVLDPGWRVYRRDRVEGLRERTGLSGTHGYDPREADMRALFIAHGPGFRSGSTVAPFENIHLYALMTHLLALDPAPTDGSLDAVRAMLNGE